jgi:ferredoxin
MASIILLVLAGVFFLGLSAFTIVSLIEGEKRAARISILLALGFGVALMLAALLPAWLGTLILIALALLAVLGVIAFISPVGRVDFGKDVPQNRFDERDMMFARSDLVPGSPEFQAYYQMRPENKQVDDRTRAKPGLFSPDAKLADPYLFAVTKSSFYLTDALYDAVDGPVAAAKQKLPPEEMTLFLKSLTEFYGACQVGVAELQPYHLYSHIGRGNETYGAPINTTHRFALAFAVEMEFQMSATSPNPQITVETGKQYVEAARVAVQVAAALRNLGYPARAHIDGNYRVIAPLVARDAGLGEIGRMGLLMTPNLGPRVRLGVVTTEAELVPDGRRMDSAVIDFCNICKKCAENCPSRSISFDERQEIDGALRWKIDSESCFHYWSIIGTDCGRCMAVCPYSHPDNLAHNLIRWGIARSGAFRRGALWLDDLFYGVRPTSHPSPEWTKLREGD